MPSDLIFVNLGSDGVFQVHLLPKIMTRLRATNFCPSSARFAPSFVRQPNGPECTQIVRNSPKRQFRVQWGGSGVFIVKNSGGGSGVFLVKNSDTTSWHELLHYFRPFYTKFCKAIERSQMHPNSMKRTKRSV